MAGSFTSPSGATPKSKHGKANRPKRSSSGQGVAGQPRDYPITDSFASKSIPRKRRDASCHRSSFAKR